MARTPLVLKQRLALGDTVLLTALVRDIHRAYPGRFDVSVVSDWTQLWVNNPHVVPVAQKPAASPTVVDVEYRRGITEAGRGRPVHMLAWYHEDFRMKTGMDVPVTFPGGDIHLTEAESAPFVKGRYWLVFSGGKLDMTAKWWSAKRYQQVVDTLAACGVRCVQVGADHQTHVHLPLANTVNLVGCTENVRDLFGLIKHADGVICGVTGAMHLAAAFERPCVVVAGGREEPWWEAYTDAYAAFGPRCPPVKVPHRFLHTLGQIHCCQVKGCWRSRTVPIEPKDHTPARQRAMCVEPVRAAGEPPLPLCMDMITVDHVVEAALSYYADGTLPPLCRERNRP